MKEIRFNSTKEMRTFLENRDLYNLKSHIYVFVYNNAGSLCYYRLTNEEAQKTADEAREIDDAWSATLGPGGYIIDDPETIQEFLNDTFADKSWYIADQSYGQRTYKLHARVTKEIEVTKSELNNLIEYLNKKNLSGNEEICNRFKEGINSGGYDEGYIPNEWLMVDLLNQGFDTSSIHTCEDIDL